MGGTGLVLYGGGNVKRGGMKLKLAVSDYPPGFTKFIKFLLKCEKKRNLMKHVTINFERILSREKYSKKMCQ